LTNVDHVWPPTRLTRRTHVLLDGAFADPNAELQELTADPFRSPETILGSHLPDQPDHIGSQSSLLRSRPGSSAPEEAEAFPMPPQNGLWLHDGEPASPHREQRSCSQNSEPIQRGQPGLGRFPAQDDDLATASPRSTATKMLVSISDPKARSRARSASRERPLRCHLQSPDRASSS
jgi:hypothetical protein